MAAESLSTFLDVELGEVLKSAADGLKRAQSALRAAQRAAERGEMWNLAPQARAVVEQTQTLAGAAQPLPATADSFDFTAYCDSGRYGADFAAACTTLGLRIEGTFPSYEVFPLRIQFNVAERFATIEGRRVRQLRPQLLAQLIQTELQRLAGRPFNAGAFLQSLAEAYDTVVALRLLRRGGKSREQIPMRLMDVYRVLTPMAAFRRSYSPLMFAYDLGRLLRSGVAQVDGRDWHLGSTRDARSALRIVDPSGREMRYGTIAFGAPRQPAETRA